MGFLVSTHLSNPFSIQKDVCLCSVPLYSIKARALSAFTFPEYSARLKKGFLNLQWAHLNEKLPVVQCNGNNPGGGGEEENGNMVNPIFAKESLSISATVALGLLCSSDALADTCPDYTGPIFNMPILFGIALIGAAVGGLIARRRRFELERLNNQLRQINTVLKRQARIESYAPNLSYAPVGRSVDTETINTRRDEMMSKLKAGKRHLKSQIPEKALEEFKGALEIAQSLGDPVETKKAARGLGAACQQQRKYREAIKYHSMIISISEREEEYSGETEAYGAIADCYTELGDLETAAKYYDKYIARLETD